MEFRFLIPDCCRGCRKREREARRVGDLALAVDLVAVGVTHELSGVGQGGESFVEGGVSYAAVGALFFDGQWTRGLHEDDGDTFIEGAGAGSVTGTVCARCSANASPRDCSSSGMLGGEGAARCSIVRVSVWAERRR